MAGSNRIVISVPDELLEYIVTFQKDNLYDSPSKAICEMIRQYRFSNSQRLADEVVNKLDEKYRNMFTRIRLGSTMADKNTQVLLECFNALAWQMDLKPMPTIVVETEVIEDSRKVVNERIAHFKQKKDWQEKK